MNQNTDLNSVASANRIHIGFFGCRNAGKSSLVNAVTGQDLAVVSDVRGTTTDPVVKAMELLPLGPVVVIDTPGFDDAGLLGDLRVRKTRQILNRTDIAVLVVDETLGFSQDDHKLLELFSAKQISHLIAFNKSDLKQEQPADTFHDDTCPVFTRPNGTYPDSPDTVSELAATSYDSVPQIRVSAVTGSGIHELKEMIGSLMPKEDPSHTVTKGLLEYGQTVLLVCPIDKAAPKGRLIMPQQMTIRSIMDSGGIPLITRESELAQALDTIKQPPALVITDSQVFSSVARMVPEEIPLTSFSILMARYKGFLETSIRGVRAVADLKNGDRILMAEGCTHHRQCGDIGTVKIPGWLRAYSKTSLAIDTCSGKDFPEDLSPYAAVIHCGGCMITEREIMYRMKCAQDQDVPFTNYGIIIAHMKGILERSLRVFPDIHAMIAS